MSDPRYYPIELLHWAGMKDQNIDELIDILITHPEYVNETNDFGDNCLFIAARNGNLEMVKYILNNTSININHTNGDGSVLLIALSQNHLDVVSYLIDSTSINVHLKNKKGEGIYHLAAKAGNADLVEKLLELDKKKRIGDLDNNNRHCLFQLIDNYPMHKDFWCFDLIQEHLSDKELWQIDIEGMNILDFTNSRKYIQAGGYQIDRTKLYAPLINVLKSRNN